jgi:hypothetical protein
MVCEILTPLFRWTLSVVFRASNNCIHPQGKKGEI